MYYEVMSYGVDHSIRRKWAHGARSRLYATLPQVTPVVVEVARESLVIGTA